MPESPFQFEYTKRFDPQPISYFSGKRPREVADTRERPPYVYNDHIVLAVNVALASGRPLLVRGPTGCGKSTLARNAAHVLKRRYYEHVITSRTQAKDLLYEVDLLSRLHDAQAAARDAGTPFDSSFDRYVKPGALWWAFDRKSALWNGRSVGHPGITKNEDPCTEHPDQPAVVLIDEIDKADPDVPNNLLVPLGSLRFRVDETGIEVATTPETAPLVIITTNDERQLPTAFLRRCVELKLPTVTRATLENVGRAHFKGTQNITWIRGMLDALLGKGDAQDEVDLSPAELVDTLCAANGLSIDEATRPEEWKALTGITVFKSERNRNP
ncbi:MAG: MoxR family ATPase [Planctomycetota bacterium]